MWVAAALWAYLVLCTGSRVGGFAPARGGDCLCAEMRGAKWRKRMALKRL
jgi:hypothetical protein